MIVQTEERSNKQVILKPALIGPSGVFLVGIMLVGISVIYNMVGPQDGVAGIDLYWRMLAAVLGVLFMGWGVWGIIGRVRGKLYVRIDR